MKNVAKAVVLAMVILPVAFLGGCAKRCGTDPCKPEPLCAIKTECGGK